MTTDIATMERIEKQKRDAIHSEVVVKNKANNFHLENTKKLNQAIPLHLHLFSSKSVDSRPISDHFS